MTCMDCGRWTPADRETGYDADDLCAACQDERDALEEQTVRCEHCGEEFDGRDDEATQLHVDGRCADDDAFVSVDMPTEASSLCR
jgi:predicted amidophosphoribosyltransferase